MSYKLEKLEFSKACEKISEYQYALLYMISEVILNKTELLGEINWEECTEARFFSEDKELHFFDVDGKKQAVAVSDEDGKRIRACRKVSNHRELRLCERIYWL